MTFRIGQQVVCIRREKWCEAMLGEACPAFNQILTVRNIVADPRALSLQFEEIINPPIRHREGTVCEVSFAAYWFRPLVDKQTDIGFAHEILRKASRTKETVA